MLKLSIFPLALFFLTLGEKVYPFENSLRIALPVVKLQLDPQKIEDLYSTIIANQIFAKLFKYTPDGQIRPELVKSWTRSKDKCSYSFELKKTSFSDGSPITAHHVVNSLKRIFYIKAALASDLQILKGAKSYAKTGKLDDLAVKAADDYTVQIETEKPTSILLHLLAVPDVGTLKLASPIEDVIITPKYPFSGTYKIIKLSEQQIIIHKWKNSDLENKHSPINVDFNLFTKVDASIVLNGILTDTSNFMTFDGDHSPVEGAKGWRPIASEASNERFIVMNPAKIPKQVRKWLASKVNSDEFVKFIGDETIVPAYGFIPNCLPGHLKTKLKQKDEVLDLSKVITIKISHGSNLPYRIKFRDYFTKIWHHPMIRLEFEELPINTYLDLLFRGGGEIILGARGLEYPEGFSIVTYFRSNLPSNYFHVANKEIDKLIDLSSEEIDDSKRYLLYQRIQELALKETTVIPLAFGSWKKYYWSQRVEEVPPHPIGFHFVPLEMISMSEK